MQTIHLTSYIESDGVLQLQIPPFLRNQNLEILVVLQAVAQPESNAIPESLDWLEFIERTYGSLADDLLVRPPQDESEIREVVE